jgi:hypothetical protein
LSRTPVLLELLFLPLNKSSLVLEYIYDFIGVTLCI